MYLRNVINVSPSTVPIEKSASRQVQSKYPDVFYFIEDASGGDLCGLGAATYPRMHFVVTMGEERTQIKLQVSKYHCFCSTECGFKIILCEKVDVIHHDSA